MQNSWNKYKNQVVMQFITRQVYNLFQDLWNEFLACFQKVLNVENFAKMNKKPNLRSILKEDFMTKHFFNHLHHQRTFLVVTSINKKEVIVVFVHNFYSKIYLHPLFCVLGVGVGWGGEGGVDSKSQNWFWKLCYKTCVPQVKI